MFGNVRRKRGRPLTDGSRRHTIKVRMSDREYDALCEASDRSGLSQSDIIRMGVKIKIDFIENGLNNL